MNHLGLVTHRGRIDIIAAILRAILGGSKDQTKTNIAYRTLLSHSQVKKYLPILLDKQFVSYHQESRVYRVTRRGINFLQLYEQVACMLDNPT